MDENEIWSWQAIIATHWQKYRSCFYHIFDQGYFPPHFDIGPMPIVYTILVHNGYQ